MLTDHATHYSIQGCVKALYDPITARMVRGGARLVYIKKFTNLSHEVAVNLLASVLDISHGRTKATNYLLHKHSRNRCYFLIWYGNAFAHLLNGSIHVRIYTEPKRLRG